MSICGFMSCLCFLKSANGVIKVANGAEWNFCFNVGGAEGICGMDFACAKTVVDFVFGGADAILAVERGLI